MTAWTEFSVSGMRGGLITSQYKKCNALLALLCIALVGISCAAKKPTRSFSDVPQRLHRGNTVYVLDDAGIEKKGKVIDVSASALILDVNGTPQRIDENRVRQIDRYGDSLWNGLFIGIGVGAAAAVFSDPQYKPCESQPLKKCADYQVGLRVASVGLMGAAGAGIDALIRHKNQVYLASNKSSQSRVRILFSPVSAPLGFSVVVSSRFR